MTGTELREIRQRLGLSQAGLARVLRSTSSSVARHERGEMRIGGPFERLVLLVAALSERGGDIEQLVSDAMRLGIVRSKRGYYMKLDPDLIEAMKRFRSATGTPMAQQIDAALREWLAERPAAWVIEKEVRRKRTRKSVPTARSNRAVRTDPTTR